ncbi:hypothetical protein MYCTH_2135162 [Thermothelomyces thermophilus ATCC 42464]|uniref:Uncharacterized protein n=1 Tax=Thermothelomyces thermophilus (strain ATCC 42464 / BCRC 31852 / DSM 1799) TaxID=573729 RepID=G2QK18_THET4|nr:uncharacterized protein MYCTH_2135162 [Thermothelomyces thermophilus ATCC 42464]AEO59924.1 hypothetical protein MYCTH_2135162 [Thermothelomyces thermophilus ATCC 42464]
MPTKRLSPSSDANDVVNLPLKKTQRTHEENQERAYIAASRRADRDIEHRIRSALKASECRRKRTGRGLKITREAVIGDEQYESEDDDHASRRFSMPATTSTTASSLSNPYVQSPSRAADRYAEIDALFAKHFPHVQLSSQWSRQHQTTHRYSYSQPSLGPQAQAHPGRYVPRFQQQQQQHQHHQNSSVQIPVPVPATFSNTAMTTTTTTTTTPPTAAPTSSPSCSYSPALLTPPVSYPLPPAACGNGEAAGSPTAKSGSMSPLLLENQHSSLLSSSSSRPGSAFSAAAQQATVGLGLASGYLQQVATTGAGGDLDSHDGAAAALSCCFGTLGYSAETVPAGLGADDPLWYSSGDHGPGATAAGGRGGLTATTTTTTTATTPTAAAAAAAAAATTTTTTASAPAQAGWQSQSRSLSLPSALEQFQFFPAFEQASIGEEEPSDALIDPGILASGSGVAAGSGSGSVPVDGFDAGAPGEPWADWINLDGDAPAPLGVEV